MRLSLGFLLVVGLTFADLTAAAAKDRTWQKGLLLDTQQSTASGGAVTIPVGGTPPTTVNGVVFPGQSPTLFTVPLDQTVEILTIKGADNIVYAASRPIGSSLAALQLVVSDPITYAIDGNKLFVQTEDKGKLKEHRFVIIKRTREP
jgi:hypothetical protein